jgi:Ca2+-binding RTX toxin-like protein
MFVFVNGLGDKVPWPLNSDIDGDSSPDGVDWNGDGDTNDGVVPPQNVDTSDMTSGNPARCTNGSANSLLTGHDDWSVIALNFRLFGDPDDGSLNPITEPEPTLDEIRELQDVLDRACGGLAPTIVGTPGDDIIRGTAGDDVINGLGGNDAIFGGGGNDVICGGPGSDKLSGGSGDDRIFGGDGNDGLNGGSGDDVLAGGPGHDKLNGRSGIDKCVTGETLRSCEL